MDWMTGFSFRAGLVDGYRQPRPARRAPPRVDIDGRIDPAQQCPRRAGGTASIGRARSGDGGGRSVQTRAHTNRWTPRRRTTRLALLAALVVAVVAPLTYASVTSHARAAVERLKGV